MHINCTKRILYAIAISANIKSHKMNSNFKKIYEKSDLILTKDIPEFDGEAAEGS